MLVIYAYAENTNKPTKEYNDKIVCESEVFLN